MQRHAEEIAASQNSQELARFNAMAAQWWAPDGPMMALHKMNPVRVTWMRDVMARHFRDEAGKPRNRVQPGVLADLSILDIGCGGGILSESLARLGANVTGLEPAEKNLAIAKDHARNADLDIDYRGDSAEQMAASGRSFDVVCAMEVVEHVNDMPAFVATAASMVRPGGLLFVSTLNRTFKSFALAIIGAEYVLRWVPAGTHQWEKFITPKELEEAIKAAGPNNYGPRVFERTGIVYNPLTRMWRTSSDMDINYMFAARRSLRR